MFGERYACTEQDMLNKLNKVPTPQSEAMLKGIAFEDCVRAGIYAKSLTSTDGIKYDFEFNPEIIHWFMNETKGGIWQQYVEFYLDCGGYWLYLYGYIDVLRQNHTLDIKTTSQYAFPKYLDDYQHMLYLFGAKMLGAQVDYHEYLITDQKECYREYYQYQPKRFKESLLTVANDMVFFLESRKEFITNHKVFGA